MSRKKGPKRQAESERPIETIQLLVEEKFVLLGDAMEGVILELVDELSYARRERDEAQANLAKAMSELRALIKVAKGVES